MDYQFKEQAKQVADIATDHVKSIEIMAPWFVIATFAIIGLLAIREKTSRPDPKAGSRILTGLMGTCIILLYPAFVILAASLDKGPAVNVGAVILRWYGAMATRLFFPAFAGLSAGLITILIIKRFIVTWFSEFKRSKRNEVGIEAPSDVRTEATREPKNYDPEKFFTLSGQKSGKSTYFLGLDDFTQPLYTDDYSYHQTHKMLAGSIGFGKGVQLGVLLKQSALKGNCVILIDPAEDENLPVILMKAAKEAGKKFRYLSLNDDDYGQWAPFRGGSSREGLKRLEMAFRIEYTGNQATDFYRTGERAKLIPIFEKDREVDALLAILKQEEDAEAAQAQSGNKWAQNRKVAESRIVSELKRWRELKALRPAKGKGFDLEQAIADGDVIYVKGSVDDDVIIAAAKVLCIQVGQIAKRTRYTRNHQISMAIDEFGIMTCREISKMMATCRKYRLDITIAFQSREDLGAVADQPGAGKIIERQIDQNAQIKMIYGGTNRDNADWVAKMSGDTHKMVPKAERTQTNSLGGEVWDEGRLLGSHQEALVHPNIVLQLPKRVCVVFKGGLAKVAYTSPVVITDKERNDYANWVAHKIENSKQPPPAPQLPSDEEAANKKIPATESVENGSHKQSKKSSAVVKSGEGPAKLAEEDDPKIKKTRKRRRRKKGEESETGDQEEDVPTNGTEQVTEEINPGEEYFSSEVNEDESES